MFRFPVAFSECLTAPGEPILNKVSTCKCCIETASSQNGAASRSASAIFPARKATSVTGSVESAQNISNSMSMTVANAPLHFGNLDNSCIASPSLQSCSQSDGDAEVSVHSGPSLLSAAAVDATASSSTRCCLRKSSFLKLRFTLCLGTPLS